MGHMYFVRHGQTVWNVENKICGSTDIDLTEKGHEQAVETGKKILSENIKADIILYSPSMLHLAQRIYNLLDDVKASGKVCVLVAHNGIARVVNSYFNDMTNEEYADFGVKNCEILRYDF